MLEQNNSDSTSVTTPLKPMGFWGNSGHNVWSLSETSYTIFKTYRIFSLWGTDITSFY